jgi:SNF2 family DNA or RNA helicase
MSRTIRMTPAGRLIAEGAPDAVPELDEERETQLDAAFARSSPDGLLLLATSAFDCPLPAAMVYWRDFARRCFHALCHASEDGAPQWERLDPPSDSWAELIAEAPPMRGLEYLAEQTLDNLWRELHAAVTSAAKAHPEGPEAYLRGVNPLLRLLGRVTFHLAENKRDPQRPFAFLATYTHRVSAKAKLQHRPLAQALKEYAGAKDQVRLKALLAPVQAAAEKSPLVRELLDSKALFQPQAWSIRQAYRFLREAGPMEEAGLVVRLPDWWSARRPTRPQVRVQLGEKKPRDLGEGSLLDFSVDVALDGEPLSEEERRQILEATDGLALLRGKWVEVDPQQLQAALAHWELLASDRPDGVTFIEGMRLLAGAAANGEAEEEGAAADWSRIVAGDWLRETLSTLRDPQRVASLTPGADLNATLRPYQCDGVRWLWFMTRLGLGGCLADDMGLGKTIQVIDLLLHLKRQGGPRSDRPSLLVAPASLVGNWRSELERFGPSLRVFYLHRSETDAESIQRIGEQPQRELSHYDLVVTTYNLARQSPWLHKTPWRLAVLDEAQAIKNASSAQTKAVKKLDALVRLALTGTPVENHVGDLWSIFDFCCPGLLGSATQFKTYVKRLNRRQDAEAFGSLRRLVRPYILRRLKTDPNIVPDLPDKTEMRVECGLSKKQAALYEQALADLAARLENAEGIARHGLVLGALMQFKQICNHPALYLRGASFTPEESGKFARLAQICETLIERQEKMLVFTQFQSLCDPLAEFLAGVFGRPGLTLHGKTAVRRRSDLVKQFQQDGGPPFLVISLKAGGSGLNLTAASHVVHFDRWWNPAVENQATDRAFRIGQKKNVLVHKFVCRGTVEERIDLMIRDKLDLADRLLDQGAEAALTEMSDDALLRFVSLDLNRATGE